MGVVVESTLRSLHRFIGGLGGPISPKLHLGFRKLVGRVVGLKSIGRETHHKKKQSFLTQLEMSSLYFLEDVRNQIQIITARMCCYGLWNGPGILYAPGPGYARKQLLSN